MNVMLVSVAVWVGEDMGEATRHLMHWIAAAVGLPVVLLAGMPFYRSALGAIRAGRANMDLAVSLGVIATAVMSLSETLRNGPYTWFDGATLLLALLLAGRVLDRSARGRARRAVAELLALQQGRHAPWARWCGRDHSGGGGEGRRCAAAGRRRAAAPGCRAA